MKSFRSPMIEIKLSESGVPDEIQIFRPGTFYHEKYGKFVITPADIQAMERNFKAGVRGVDIAVDYKHASEDIAAGWFKELFIKPGNELWAKVDWTPNGSRVLAEKEFRYISPDFIFNYTDNETLKKFGPVLLGAGLTNRPTIKNMEPVVLSETPIINPSQGNKKMDVKNMTAEQIDQMSIEDLKAALKSMLADAPKPDDKKPDASPEMKALQEKLAMAEKQLADAAAAKVCAEKKSEFALLLSEGKACQAQEQSYLDGDMKQFISLAQPSLKLSDVGTGVVPATVVPVQATDSSSAQDEVLKLAEAKCKANSGMDMTAAISMVLHENKELKAKIYE
jgi:hypothetical protein